MIGLDEYAFCNICRFLTVFKRLGMLAKLGHDSTQLEMKLTEITVGLKLGAELLVGQLLVLLLLLVIV